MADSAEHGRDIASYKLPVCDVQKERRNFMGLQEDTYYTLKDMQEGDCSGMTETDHVTSGKEDGHYTEINYKSGKVRDWSGKQLSTDSVSYTKDTMLFPEGKQTKNPSVGNTMDRGR